MTPGDSSRSVIPTKRVLRAVCRAERNTRFSGSRPCAQAQACLNFIMSDRGKKPHGHRRSFELESRFAKEVRSVPFALYRFIMQGRDRYLILSKTRTLFHTQTVTGGNHEKLPILLRAGLCIVVVSRIFRL